MLIRLALNGLTSVQEGMQTTHETTSRCLN